MNFKKQQILFLIGMYLTIFVPSAVALIDEPFYPTPKFSSDDTVPVVSCTDVVTNVEELKAKLTLTMPKGYTLCLAPGTYRDIQINYGGNGTQEQPITLAAQEPGTALITGNVNVRMAGNYVILQGLVFRGGSSIGDLIGTRSGKAMCDYCRITDISIINFDYKNPNKSKWIILSGQYNRVDHSWFSGKLNLGTLLMVDRRTPKENYAQIDHNYFGYRPAYGGKRYPDTKDSDLEIIRVGSSLHYAKSSFSKIEYNLFENIKAETEIISVKSSHNIVHGNTIRGCYGLISNRHGSHSIYSNNFIFGGGYPFAGGIRIIDSDHIVVNNYIERVGYSGEHQFGGIVLLSSLDQPDRNEDYKQVENITIAHNTLVNTVNSIIVDGSKHPNPPRNITFLNNIVAGAEGAVLTHARRGLPKGSVFAGNFFHGDRLTDNRSISNIEGVSYSDAKLLKSRDGLYRPSSTSRDILIPVAINDPVVKALIGVDMDGQIRPVKTFSGADEVSIEPVDYYPIEKSMVGPRQYQPDALK